MEVYLLMEINIESELKLAITHDFHKIHGISHLNSEIKLKGKKEGLNGNADEDASKMSRNHIKTPTFNNGDRNYRTSLVTGYSLMPNNKEILKELKNLTKNKKYNISDTKEMFINLLNCNELSKFNESPDLEFTSLKYHSILTTVLYYHYLKGYKFDDLYFGIINLKENKDIFETIFIDKQCEKCFVIKPNSSELKFFTKLGVPMENFGYVLGRCGNTEYIQFELLSNLRRISSWSTGLQYYDDICRGSL